MATFPAAPLPEIVELLIDGGWVDVTSDVREESGISITRGRADGSARVTPSRLNLTLDNRSAKYSNRMPTALYYGKLGRNTQLRHRIRWVYDTMDRNVADTWSSTNSGQAWTNAGTTSDYFGDGAKMFHKHTSRNVYRSSTLTLPVGTADVTATFSAPAVATGGAIYFHVLVGSDLSNYYAATATLSTAGTVTLGIGKMAAGVLSAVGSTAAVGSYAADTKWSVRLQRTGGGLLRAKAWLGVPADQPSSWTVTTTVPDTNPLTTFTMAGVRSLLDVANTNTLDVFLAWWDFEVADWRFWGEVPSWPQTWDTTGRDVTAPIEAAGIMRRLGAGAKPLRSALTRAISTSSVVPSAYWPCEDSADGLVLTSAVSPIAGVSPMIALGASNFASTEGAPGSDVQPSFSAGGSLLGIVPDSGATSSWRVQAAWKANTITAGDFAIPLSWVTADGNAWELDLNKGVLAFSETLAFSAPTAAAAVDDGLWHEGRVTATQNGGNIDIKVYFDGAQVIAESIAGTVSRVRKVQANSTADASNILAGIGHFVVWNGSTSTPGLDTVASMRGYVGETAVARMARLCSEEGVPLDLIGDAGDTAAMGPQRIGKLLDLLVGCGEADQGILHESRDAFSLLYRTRTSLYNQSGLTLDYAARQIHPPFAPTEDDRGVVNDSTARRVGGSWSRVVATTGPLSTQAPPNGAGTYDEDRTYNVYADDQLEPLAGWRVHVGTWDEARYPQIHANLAGPGFTASPALTGQVAAVDVGDYLSVTNPPAWLPPDRIEQLAQGYRETHYTYEWDITWNCVPAGPYTVFVLDSATLGRLEGDQALHTGVNSGATSWNVATLSGPLMTPADTEDGWQWLIEGELVTVTDVAASPITFISAGATSSGSSGSRTPGGPAGGTAGDLILILASTRNSGTGIPDTPTDWTRLPAFEATSNVQLFARIYDGVWAMPTVTFTGGAANEDTIAQSAMIRGKFHSVANAVVASAGCLNASAQDIQYPGLPLTNLVDDCIILYLGWKQDDYTSVATIAGATEIGEASSIAGNDASQIWDYAIQTTAAFIPPGTFTVTGGAAAISRGAVIAIRSDYQVATVTRSVNGVSKAHSAGAVPALYPAPHLAL